MPWSIYCHTHIESGRRYIGLTSQTWQKRWKNHVSAARSSKGGRWHFSNAIRKYGKDAFSHEILEICDSLEAANLAEEKWITHFDSRNSTKGFNLAKGGEHIPHPIRMNPWHDPEFRAKYISDMSACHTPEARAASRAALKRPDIVAKMSAAAKASQSSPEFKILRSRISREIVSRPEVLVKISSAAKRRKIHCKNGHSLEDSIQRSNGQRACRQCAIQRTKIWRKKVV